MENSKIEWTDHTFNPWVGCSKVSPGCQHCYAETLMDKRWGKVQWGPQGTRVRTSAANWRKPLQWNKRAKEEGVRYRVFCASLADVMEDKLDQRSDLGEWRNDLFSLIEQTPNLDWLLLTKRPENVNDMISQRWGKWLPINVWIGTSVENQEQAEKRIPHLLKVRAAVRFLSMEPLLGPVDLKEAGALWTSTKSNEIIKTLPEWRLIHWVIVGGESGNNARPMHPNWVRSIRDQCVAAGIPFHFKQWGEWIVSSHVTQGMMEHQSWSWPWATGKAGDLHGDTTMMIRVGKKMAGRILDRKTWDEYPGTVESQLKGTSNDNTL